MPRPINPKSIAPPFSKYAHAVEVAAGTRLLFVSGQVGIMADGRMAPTEEGQHEQAWKNVLTVLAEAGMTARDIVEVTVLITGRSGVPLFRAARDRALAGHEAATTLHIVAGLAGPDWLVEITVVAGQS
jgi:2-iminobutanoate/2-iminopropanoate deaminase